MIRVALKLAESWGCGIWRSVPFGGPFCTNHGIISKEIGERLCLRKKGWQVDHAECKVFSHAFGKVKERAAKAKVKAAESQGMRADYLLWFSSISFRWWTITYLTNTEPHIAKPGVFSREGGGFNLSALCTRYTVLLTHLMMAFPRVGDISSSSLSVVLSVAFPMK